MLRSVSEIMNYTLDAKDGEIGRCRDFLFDDQHWTIRYMVADTGKWLPGIKVLISPLSLEEPEWATRKFPVTLIKEQITSIYPEIGACDINVDAEWDDNEKTWIVNPERDGRKLKTHLEPEDAKACIEGKQCVALGFQIEQLKDNIEKMPG